MSGMREILSGMQTSGVRMSGMSQSWLSTIDIYRLSDEQGPTVIRGAFRSNGFV